MTLARQDYLIIGLVNAVLFLGLGLQSLQQGAYSQSQNQNQTDVLCNELAILNSLVQDTEVLPSTAAGNSTSERECGFKPNIVPEVLERAENQNNDSDLNSANQ